MYLVAWRSICGIWLGGLLLIGSPLLLQWQLRTIIGPTSVPIVIFGCAPIALIVLASAHNLSLYEEAAQE